MYIEDYQFNHIQSDSTTASRRTSGSLSVLCNIRTDDDTVFPIPIFGGNAVKRSEQSKSAAVARVFDVDPFDGCVAILFEQLHHHRTVTRSSYKAHEYDFYKPHLNSPFPEVNGKVSNACYLNAFDSCFDAYRRKMGKQWRPVPESEIKGTTSSSSTSSPDPLSPHYWVFHAPYNKLVRKTCGRVVYHDFLSRPRAYFEKYAGDQATLCFLKKYEHVPCGETINNRDVIKGFEKLSTAFYEGHVSPSTTIPRAIGNCYTASIFMGLVSLIAQCANGGVDKVMGKTVQMFSYGSGTVASLYSLHVVRSDAAKRALCIMAQNNDVDARLKERKKMPCDEYERIMDAKLVQFHADDQKSSELVPRENVDIEYFYPKLSEWIMTECTFWLNVHFYAI